MEQDATPKPDAPQPEDQLSISQHSVTIDGQEIRYTVTAGRLVLKTERKGEGEDAGKFEGQKPSAEVFFVAYTRDDVSDLAERPVTFSFNGGPGSSSVWLHLGVLGPRRVQLPEDDIRPAAPPYKLVKNAYSLLDKSDLVFIDPVSTGYSRPVEGEKAADFHTLKKDIESVGAFIRLYVTRYGRWASPKFLAGESYGTTRAAGLAGHLQERGMYLNGLMLISCVLDFTTIFFTGAHNNELPYFLILPSYAATAWYHGRLEQSLQDKPLEALLDEVEAFALETYAPALLKGSSLPDEDKRQLARDLARYTGLGESYIERSKLRVDLMRFSKELLRDEGRTVGRLDSRFKGVDRDDVGEAIAYDPSHAAISGPFGAMLNHYLRQDLGFESDLPYELLSMDVNQSWKWETENAYVDVAETLRQAMTVNPHLKVHVANGYYDLATPHFAAEYTFNHLSLDQSLEDNISMSYYEAGHMMYIHQPSLVKLKQALAAFVEENRA